MPEDEVLSRVLVDLCIAAGFEWGGSMLVWSSSSRDRGRLVQSTHRTSSSRVGSTLKVVDLGEFYNFPLGTYV